MRRAARATHTTVRVTADELARLKARAARHGRSLSRYLVERGLADGADAWPERQLAHEQAMVAAAAGRRRARPDCAPPRRRPGRAGRPASAAALGRSDPRPPKQSKGR